MHPRMVLPFGCLLLSLFTLSVPSVRSQIHLFPTRPFQVNTSLVLVGTSFTGTCLLAGYSPTVPFSPGNSAYTVVFYRTQQVNKLEAIATYEYADVLNVTTVRHPKVTLNPRHYADLTLSSLSANSTAISLSIHPETDHPYTYLCQYGSDTNVSAQFTSKATPVSVVKSLPQVTLLSGTSQFLLNEPSLFTCRVTQFNRTQDTPDSTYVTFYSKRDGLLLRYDYSAGHLLVYIRKHANLIIHRGVPPEEDAQAESGFPNFYLSLTMLSDLHQELWCSLEATHFQTFESNHWNGGAIVNFSSLKVNPTTRLGTCQLNFINFQETGNYTVKFHSDHGPEKVNLLGSYIVKPRQAIEFDSEDVPGWTEILYSGVPAFPIFAITASGKALNGSWWCTVAIGTEGTADYYEYSSGKLDLA